MEERFSEAHRLDAERLEELVHHVVAVTASANLLDHAAEQAVAEVRVHVALAGVEVQLPAHHEADDVVLRGGRRLAEDAGDLDGVEQRVDRLLAIPAALMPQQVGDGHLAKPGVGRVALGQVRLVRQQVEHRRVEAELALLDQLQRGGGGERLGDAGDAEQRLGLHQLLFLDIRITKAARVNQATVLGHGQRRAGDLVVADERLHQLVERLEFGKLPAGGDDRFAFLRFVVRRRCAWPSDRQTGYRPTQYHSAGRLHRFRPGTHCRFGRPAGLCVRLCRAA